MDILEFSLQKKRVSVKQPITSHMKKMFCHFRISKSHMKTHLGSKIVVLSAKKSVQRKYNKQKNNHFLKLAEGKECEDTIKY